MTYIFLAAVGIISFLVILGFITFGDWESKGRMVNANWLTDEEKFHFISRWGA